MGISTSLSQLDRLWLCEAIRLREEHTGVLDDRQINRQVLRERQGFAARLERRAELLAERDGQAQALRHYRQGAKLAFWLLLIAALLAGASLGLSALGRQGGAVNVFWVLASVLGLNLLTLAGWLISHIGAPQSSASLGRLWLWLSEKLARDAQAAHLVPALMLLFERQNLLRWGLGLLSHSVWLVVALASTLAFLALLATRQYGFYWETTLLSSEAFISLTQSLGALPKQLGFALPSIEAIQASDGQALLEPSARQAWASWLLGVMLVYGIVPRAVLFGLCIWRWKAGLAKLSLDLTAPGYQLLRDTLEPPSQVLEVSDPAPDTLPSVHASQALQSVQAAVVVGIELDPNEPWPPEALTKVHDGGRVETREQRAELLNALSARPAARLCVVCDARRSPDRGTLALLAELGQHARATRLWLTHTQTDPERLGHWHSALTGLGLAYTHTPPNDWLEADDE